MHVLKFEFECPVGIFIYLITPMLNINYTHYIRHVFFVRKIQLITLYIFIAETLYIRVFTTKSLVSQFMYKGKCTSITELNLCQIV